ncbi:hypothetical protein CCAX7_10850 [Capsulimonas corticalis]|uniref:Uncharacterized protein n=1 Tax=Capsulimonas corticalis TaxID=2219043 RepID=A0A402CUP6_9BACT|nr:hypothetical protein [Capsulimonas corticalis]BDI29034.1 hypothetical protein CCAX7_10850 [Capsulimonas corticalis]
MAVQHENSGVITYTIPVFSLIAGVENILREQLLNCEAIWLWCNYSDEELNKDPGLANRYSLQHYRVISPENIDTVMREILSGGNLSYGEDFTIYGLDPSVHDFWRNEEWLEDNLRMMGQGIGGVWIIINQLSDVSSQQIFVSPDPASPIHAMLQTWIALTGGECVEMPYDAQSPWSFERGFLY